jgi:beta-lactamase class D
MNARLALALSLSLAAVACGAPRPGAPGAAPACPSALDGADAFARRGVAGTFVLRDERTGCVRATDPDLADVPFTPASTFKIPNALIGLETGVIRGEAHRFAWDGAPRALPEWDQELDLAGALRVSCVPCFQEVARGIGEAKMKDFVHRFGYGDEEVSGPIDRFWLGEPMRITPRQEVEFVHRSIAGELPVKPEHVALVWRLLEIERTPAAVWRGKTGLHTGPGGTVGWLVGWTERDGRRSSYATLVHGRDADRVKAARKEIARELLVRAGALPPG